MTDTLHSFPIHKYSGNRVELLAELDFPNATKINKLKNIVSNLLYTRPAEGSQKNSITDDSWLTGSFGQALPCRYFKWARFFTTVSEISGYPKLSSDVGVIVPFTARQADVPPGQLNPYCGTKALHTFK